MATRQAVIYNPLSDIIIAQRKTSTISGTVKLSGSGVERQVFVYVAGRETEVITSGYSDDSTGVFSLDLVGIGKNDKLRVICVGADGENSEIFENIHIA